MWRLAKSLEVLRDQVNQQWPARSKISDGTIGDSTHQAGASDHNPNSVGVVCALDLTNNPPYFDAHALANNLLANRHPDLKYLISNYRIAGDWTNWQWWAYSGSDPHDTHIHISVGVGDDGQSLPPYDDTIKWNIGDSMPTIATPEIVDSLAHAYLNDSLANNSGLQFYVSQNVDDVIWAFNNAQQRADFLKSIENRDKLILDLKEQLKNANQPLDQATKDQISNTNSVVNWIKEFLSKIFK